ncbi:MAG: hypothetical protein AB2421_08580 [Thermotaleaceae bacterium]
MEPIISRDWSKNISRGGLLWTTAAFIMLIFILYNMFAGAANYDRYFKPQMYCYNQFLKKADLLHGEINALMNKLELEADIEEVKKTKAEIVSTGSELQYASMETKKEIVKGYGLQDSNTQIKVKDVQKKMILVIDLYFQVYENLKVGILEDNQKKLLSFVEGIDRINKEKSSLEQMTSQLWKTNTFKIEILK